MKCRRPSNWMTKGGAALGRTPTGILGDPAKRGIGALAVLAGGAQRLVLGAA